MANSNQDYILISEGNIVSIDIQSIYTLREEFPDCVIFTELSGTSIVRGMMRLVTRIDLEWIQPYVAKMKGVNIFKLAQEKGEFQSGLKVKSERKEEIRAEADLEENGEKKTKVEEAKNRYLERKKLKK